MCINEGDDGWEETDDNSWNLLWTWASTKQDTNKLLKFQKINHFQESKWLTKKDTLNISLQRYFRMNSKYADMFKILPVTFILPKEYSNFINYFSNQRDSNIWILKPMSLSRGRGIKLINNLSDIKYGENIILQKYISNPLLIYGYKFDLRLYVLVTSFQPLEAFIYKEGFGRFATVRYSREDFDIYKHLTNTSIQKNNKSPFIDMVEGGGMGYL
eukprot:GHVL01000079.1.p1 GENE.GHVL01000079.1~~GHVL01000079.1.p1  ORF type:complete len:215 (+),score=58.95 GHVL01000079.1:548-1192(+)